MKNNEPLAFKVRKYTGHNPFTHSQARDFPLMKLNAEFVPTSKFWNRFNVSNEILIGTRGSGKTILLKMMSYSSLLSISEGPFRSRLEEEIVSGGINYIGFYVPFRLRVLSEIGKTSDKLEERRRFSFLFNCVSAGSILNEVHALIQARFNEEAEALLKEREIIDKLKEAWGVANDAATSTLKGLQEQIDRLFDVVRSNWDFQKGNHSFDSPLLEPIISVIPILNNIFGLDKSNTTWIACFDEAEYLNENLQCVINTIMRSESRGLAVKIATLPFRYTEFRTEVDEEYVQPEGDDFRFESIDYSWDENDFVELTDYLVGTRLAETGLFEEIPESHVFESFVGESSGKDLISIYRNVFNDFDDKALEGKVAKELRASAHKSTKDFSKGQIKRYKPIYLLRELYKKSRLGNSEVPRLSGDIMIRKISDGNVRKFIQICDTIFESSRTQFLRANAQHKAVFSFSQRLFTRSQSVYKEGFLLHKLLQAISDYLFRKFHDGPIMDVGVEFVVADDLLEIDKIKSALERGVAHSYFTCPQSDLFYGITSSTKFKLVNAIAAYKWLPMRAGAGTKISGRSEIVGFLSTGKVLQPKVVEELPANMELDFFDE